MKRIKEVGISLRQDAECLIKGIETRLGANYPRIQWFQFQTGQGLKVFSLIEQLSYSNKRLGRMNLNLKAR